MSNLLYINKEVERNKKMLNFGNDKSLEEIREERLAMNKEELISIIEELENKLDTNFQYLMQAEVKLDEIKKTINELW